MFSIARWFSATGIPARVRFKAVLRSISIFLILFNLLLAPMPPAFAQDTPQGPTDAAELEAFMDGLLSSQLDSNHVPGAIVVVVKDGEVFFAKGYGYRDLGSTQAVDPAKTLFRPGSISKLFTWTSVMQLVEQGKLSLDADVNTYLDFSIPATFPQPITLKNLLTHTPGFEDKSDGLFKLTAEEMSTLGTYLKDNLPDRVFPPGETIAYSNYGTALAGYIVERVSGMPFYEYVEKNIFNPLGMTQATFRQPLPDELAPDMSGGFNFVNGGYLQGGFEYVVGNPAGALSASGLEMAKFMIAHLQDGRYGDVRILQEATAQQMHSPLYAADPRLDGMAYGFFQVVHNGEYVISHGGDTLLFHSGLYLLPERNLGLFISTNGANGSKVVEAVDKAFMDRYFPVPQQHALVSSADFATRASIYPGSYYLSRNNFSTAEKIMLLLNQARVSVDDQNHVILSFAGQATRYVETEPGLLVSRNDPSDRIVMKQENGQVTLLSSMPFTLIKANAASSLPLNLLIFFGSALLFLAALIGWGISFIRGLVRHQPRPLSGRLARLSAALFGLGYLVFLVMFGLLIGDMDPAYGVPRFFFNIPSWYSLLETLPLILAVLGAVMLVFLLLTWWQRTWNLGGRLVYTLLTLSALGVLWALNFWNFLL